MRRLLSVAPVLLWLVTPLAFAQLPGITSQPLRRWTKLVAPGADAGVHHLVDVYSGNFTDDDQFHPHHHCFGLLRNALERPPRHLTGIAGAGTILTFFIMSPVIDKIYVDAYQPFSEEKISMQEALEKGRSRYVSLCCVRPVRQI